MAPDLRKRVLNVSQRQGSFPVVWCTGCVPALEVAAQPGHRQARRRPGDRQRRTAPRWDQPSESRSRRPRRHDSGGHGVEVDDSHHGALHRTDSRRDVWAACPLSTSTSAVCRVPPDGSRRGRDHVGDRGGWQPTHDDFAGLPDDGDHAAEHDPQFAFDVDAVGVYELREQIGLRAVQHSVCGHRGPSSNGSSTPNDHRSAPG